MLISEPSYHRLPLSSLETTSSPGGKAHLRPEPGSDFHFSLMTEKTWRVVS